MALSISGGKILITKGTTLALPLRFASVTIVAGKAREYTKGGSFITPRFFLCDLCVTSTGSVQAFVFKESYPVTFYVSRTIFPVA